MPPVSPRSLFSRRLWPWVLAALATLGAAALDRELRPRMARLSPPYEGAEWIWDQSSTREVQPRAFYLVKDFELDRELAAASLSILADEEYVLFVNGVRVGSNVYQPGASLDRYPVSRRLVLGGNRLVVEVRSRRGVGGMLLRLDEGPGAPPWVVSDDSWKVLRVPRPGLLGGWSPLDGAEPVQVWGPPPVGRWGRPTEGPPRPLFPVALDDGSHQPPTSSRMRELVGPSRPGIPSPRHHAVWLDWEEAAAGYLELKFAAPGPEPGLLWAGEEPPEPDLNPADAVIVVPPGGRVWMDPQLRRFRHVLLVTPSRLESAIRVNVPAAAAGSLTSPPVSVAGAFGVRPVPRVSLLEAEIRRQLPRDLSPPPSP